MRVAGAHYALFQVARKSGMTQNDRAVQLVAGDVGLVNAAWSATYFGNARWLSVRLLCRSLILHGRNSDRAVWPDDGKFSPLKSVR